MSAVQTEQEMKVERVSSLDEGRVAYIAAMTKLLSQMASAAGESHLAKCLNAATREAKSARRRMRS